MYSIPLRYLVTSVCCYSYSSIYDFEFYHKYLELGKINIFDDSIET